MSTFFATRSRRASSASPAKISWSLSRMSSSRRRSRARAAQISPSSVAARWSARRSGAFRVTTVQSSDAGETNACSGSMRSKQATSGSK